MATIAYIVLLVLLNILSLWMISKQFEAFSVTFTPSLPAPQYVYDDMLSIEEQRQTRPIKYIAVDDKNFKIIAILNKQINSLNYPVYVKNLLKTLKIDAKAVFYGYTSELQKVLRGSDVKLMPYVVGNIANLVYASYPFAHVKTFSLQMLAPLQYVERDDYINLITIPMAWVEGAKGQMKSIGYYAKDVQQFYAMLVPFKSPPPQTHIESFKVSDSEPVLLKIVQPLESIKVIQMIRDVYTRISASAQEVSSYLDNIKLSINDQLILINQKHRSINGIYYVVARNDTVLILESTKTTMFSKPLPGDRVYDAKTQLAGILQENGKILYYNDVALRARKEKCISNPSLMTRTVCESPYDLFGKKKQALDVWDRPCEYDNDCPFFDRQHFRGGCKQGICEMPLGAKQVGFRKYRVENPEFLNKWSLSSMVNVKDLHEGFVNITDAIYKPAVRQYVYFPNQPNASMTEPELLQHLKRAKGAAIQKGISPLDVLLISSGLQEKNYFIPMHQNISENIWKVVLYKYETVEGHILQMQTDESKIVDITVIGRIPEQLIQQTFYTSKT